MTDWLVAFSVDQAVWNFGEALNAALSEAEEKAKTAVQKKAKREDVFRRWLGAKGQPRQYADPAGRPDSMSKRL